MLLLITTALNLVILMFCWKDGSINIITKLVMTLLSGACWIGLVWDSIWVVVAQCVVIGIVGVATFGVEFLGRR
jgi:hypothetical protein